MYVHFVFRLHVLLLRSDVLLQDTTSPLAVVEQLNDPSVQLAVVANTASFVSAAQTSDSAVSELANEEYSDVEMAKAIQAACDAVYVMMIMWLSHCDVLTCLVILASLKVVFSPPADGNADAISAEYSSPVFVFVWLRCVCIIHAG
jgi:hypothetical protein